METPPAPAAKPAEPAKISKPKSVSRYFKWLLGLVILAAIIIGGVYVFKHTFSKSNQLYAYKYGNTNSYALAGPQAGSGITITKPVEVGPSGKSAAKASQIALSHTVTKTNQPVVIAQINMASVSVGTDVNDQYRQSVAKSMVNPSDPSYKAMVQPLQQYVTLRLSSDYNTTFSTPKALTTANINKDAWEIDFTATAKNAKQATTEPTLKGETIMAIGKSTFYYASLYAVDYNWQSNQTAWNNAINSLKIDQ